MRGWINMTDEKFVERNLDLITEYLGLMVHEVWLIHASGYEFEIGMCYGDRPHNNRDVHVSIISPDAVRNPSLTNTYHGHSGLDSTALVMNMIREFRKIGEHNGNI
jgi:hypothetical protein